MTLRMVNGRLKRMPLEVIENCDGCGACCMHMGAPPGYAAYYPWSGEIADWAKESPDYERWLNLPPEIEAELRAYYDGVKAGTLHDRTAGFADLDKAMEAIKAGRLDAAGDVIRKVAQATSGHEVPCLWFDVDAKRCKHYDHRPETCRDAIAPGDDSCRATRRHFKIEVKK